MEPINATENKRWLSFKFLKSKKDFKILKFIAVFVIITASLIIIKDEISWQLDPSATEGGVPAGDAKSEKSGCNAFGIELRGELITYVSPANLNAKDENAESMEDETSSEDIVYSIEAAENDDSIKAIILEVDSYGGNPVAGEEVSIALKKANKPTVALIRSGGASAAYLAASGVERIFASKHSDVGSIGATMSYLDNVGKNKKEGLAYIPLSSGKFKDSGDPNKSLSLEERNLFMRDVNIMHQNFVKMVAENRNLDIKKVEKLADGSTMLGEMALQNGLIDQIGGLPEVKEYLKEKIGEKAEVCW